MLEKFMYVCYIIYVMLLRMNIVNEYRYVTR